MPFLLTSPRRHRVRNPTGLPWTGAGAAEMTWPRGEYSGAAKSFDLDYAGDPVCNRVGGEPLHRFDACAGQRRRYPLDGVGRGVRDLRTGSAAGFTVRRRALGPVRAGYGSACG